MLKAYTFDTKVFATFTVRAESEAAARNWLDVHLDCATITLGVDVGNDTVTGVAGRDGHHDLMEIDGEAAS